MCSTHYNRLRTTGTINPGPQVRGTLEERFWRQVEVKGEDECWNWKAKSKIKGYGVIGRGGRLAPKVLAHRLSWELANGPVPENKDEHHGNVIMHKCDNRLCVNPNHLTLGTQAENVRDMLTKGRGVNNPPIGSKHHATTINEGEAAKLYTMNGPYKAIAQEIGCSLHVVKDIKRGKTWSHVTNDLIRG